MVWVCRNVWQRSMKTRRMNFRSFTIFFWWHQSYILENIFCRFGPTRATDSDSCSHYWQFSALEFCHWASPSTGIATGGWWSRSNSAPLRRRRPSLWSTTTRWEHCCKLQPWNPCAGPPHHPLRENCVPSTARGGKHGGASHWRSWLSDDQRLQVCSPKDRTISIPSTSGGLVARKTDISGTHKRLLSLRY